MLFRSCTLGREGRELGNSLQLAPLLNRAHTHPLQYRCRDRGSLNASSCCTTYIRLHFRDRQRLPTAYYHWHHRSCQCCHLPPGIATAEIALEHCTGSTWRQSNEIILVACGDNTTLQCYTTSRSRRLPLPRPHVKKRKPLARIPSQSNPM